MLLNKPTLKTEYITMTIEDGILICSYAENLVVTIEIAREIVEQRRSYVEGNVYPVLIDMGNIKNVETEAMKYWASKEAYDNIACVAIYSDGSLFSRIMINLWFKIDKPYKPTKFFQNEGSARLYLKKIFQN